MDSDNNKLPGVNFELEDDAEDIFRKFIEENEPVAIETDLPAPVPKPRKGGGSLSIDLHGMTLEEAKVEIESEMKAIANSGKGQWKIRVITGKGRHSGPAGGVLVREIYHFFTQTYGHLVVKIDTDPSASLVGGVPIRGHFNVTVKY